MQHPLAKHHSDDAKDRPYNLQRLSEVPEFDAYPIPLMDKLLMLANDQNASSNLGVMGFAFWAR